MRYKITTPVEGHSGNVAGVAFVDGHAEVDDDQAAALRYFRSHGYGVTPVGKAKPVDADQGDGQAERPNRSASKADWKAYAIAQGMDEADAEGMTRDQLADHYTD